MEQEEDIELQIWEYLDGLCSETDQQRIAQLIEQDAAWHTTYCQLTQLQQSLTTNFATEQPSLRFTKNVMEAVANTHIAPATQKYINYNLIRGIAAFFIIILSTLLGFALFTTNNWHTANIDYWQQIGIDKINFSSLFNSNSVKYIIAINVVLGLVLVDKMIGKRNVMTT